MIGYLAPVGADPALARIFRSYQCGLCHTLGAEYGAAYRLFAGPDMVFLNVFLDLWGEAPAETRRACVVAPVVSSLPVRARTENTRFAAAFGVYMAVEKLRDDYEDEGGWLRWLAWRAFGRGHARARAVLAEQGFPVDRVEAELRAQRVVEATPVMALEPAAAPTRNIAGALFGHAARTAGEPARPGLVALGERVGGFLFYVDNVLDLPKDLRNGGYNALARAFGLAGGARSGGAPLLAPPFDAAIEAGLAGARAQVDELEGLVATLPERPERTYVARALVHGFRDKLRRYERLGAEQRERATLRALLPPRPRLRERARAAFGRPASVLALRMRLAVALLFAWVFPRAAWAQAWWPEEAEDPSLDTGIPDTSVFETGGAAPDDGGATSTDCGTICDPCSANFGWFSCDGTVCTDPCSDTCTQTCDTACGDACADVNCGSGCDCGG